MAQIDEKNEACIMRSDSFCVQTQARGLVFIICFDVQRLAEEKAKKKAAIKRQEELEQKKRLEEEAKRKKIQQAVSSHTANSASDWSFHHVFWFSSTAKESHFLI